MTIPQARVAVGKLIGLPADYDGSMAQTNALTIKQKQALTARLIQYIVNNPGSFTVQQVATAQAESGRAATLTLQDTAATSAEIFAALGESAYNVVGAPLAAVGDGVSSGLTILGKLVPLAVVAVVVIALVAFNRRANT